MNREKLNCRRTRVGPIWRLLAREWRLENLDQFVQRNVTLEQIVPTAAQMIARQTYGRVLVNLSKDLSRI